MSRASTYYEKTVYNLEGKSKRMEQHLFHSTPTLYCIIAEGEQGILAYTTYMKILYLGSRLLFIWIVFSLESLPEIMA